MSEQNKSIVRRFVDEIWNKKDTTRLEEFLSPQYSLHTPDGAIRGVKEYRQHLDTYLKAFPDCKLTIDEILAEDNMVSARCTFTGTHKGDLQGVPPTNKSVREQCIIQAKVSGGKLSEEIVVWDRLALLEQLGVSPELMMKQAARKAGR